MNADEFIEDFASRAWRRPVGEAELSDSGRSTSWAQAMTERT